MIFICVRAGQLADGELAAVKRACKRDGICANGRPLGAVHGDVFHQAGVDVGSVLVVYLVGKPAQLPLVVNFVIAVYVLCLFPFTAVAANAVYIVVFKFFTIRIAVPALAGGIRCCFVNRVSRIAAKHRGFVRFARVVRVDTLPPNLRDSCAAKVVLQTERHIAVLELEFGFGFASFGSVSASIANSFLTCPHKVIALFHSAAAVPAAHAADRIIADNLTGGIASLHSAARVLTAHAADAVPCAGNLTGVIAFLQGAFAGAIAGYVIAAHAADKALAGNIADVIAFLQGAFVIAAHAAGAIIFAGNLAGVIAFLQGVAFVIAAHAADIRCAGNLTGVGAIFQGAAKVVIAAHTADIRCAGNTAGVGAIFQGAAKVVIAAHAAGIHFAGNLAVVAAALYITFLVITADAAGLLVTRHIAFVCAIRYSAGIVPPADAAYRIITGHIGIREGDIFHGDDCGAASANAAEQANIVLTGVVNVQPADGVTFAVKDACKRLAACANGRPRFEAAGVGNQAAVVV